MTDAELQTARECPMELFGHIGPWEDEMITGSMDQVVRRLAGMTPLDAARLILTTRRNDACIGSRELDELAEYLGVFGDDDETDDDD